jgi:phosphatidylinositol alpha-1,6-mannosyltransferase
MTRTLVVTNDFPPRPGGIQQFVHGLLVRQPADSVVVFASDWKGAAPFDAAQPFPVVRWTSSLLLPEPRVRRRAMEIARAEGCDRVLFGAAAPLGLLAPALRGAGVERSVGLTHGHEAGWTAWPGSRQLIGKVGRSVDVLTYLGEYTRSRIAGAVGPDAAARMVQLTPGVDADVFAPDRGGDQVRAALGLTDRPVVVCVSRLMARKGQDALIQAWPAVQQRVPDAALLLVGGGPYRQQLERLVRDGGLERDVVLTGSVPWADLPAHYGAGDVFAMPCRTRNRGLDVEGLGIVYLEASACGLPVVAGRSGGAPDAVQDGTTGHVVDGGLGDEAQARLADTLVELLTDPERRRRMGQAGRAWVQEQWAWERQAARLGRLLEHRPPTGVGQA